MVDWTVVVKGILFALFAQLTLIVATVTGPTYDGLVVPELAPGALYPSLLPPTGGSFLSTAASFSTFVVLNVVDPGFALVVVGVGVLFLLRAAVERWRSKLDALVPRLIVAVLLANFSLPIAAAILGLAGATYSALAGFGGGEWQQWQNLSGFGEISFSWDNGVLAFILSFALFIAVLLLAIVVALRDALLAVLLVLLPIFSLLLALPPIDTAARKAWLLFAEVAFLPCVIVVPLELAVDSPNVLLLLGYLTCALASPWLISIAGASLTGGGFPSAGSAISGAVQRGLSVATLSLGSYARPLAALAPATRLGRVAGGLARAAGSGGAGPAMLPMLTADVFGRGAAHLTRHLTRSRSPTTSFPRIQRGYPPAGRYAS